MTTVHVRLIDNNNVLIPQHELNQLVELAQRSEKVNLQVQEDNVSTLDIMNLAEQSGAFDFWKEDDENIYSIEDGKPI